MKVMIIYILIGIVHSTSKLRYGVMKKFLTNIDNHIINVNNASLDVCLEYCKNNFGSE